MKKSFLLFVGALLMTIGMSSCSSSSSDDYDYVGEFDGNEKENFIGTWHVVKCWNGWGDNVEFNSGEITVTFTKDGEMIVQNNRGEDYPFNTGEYNYSFKEFDRSIFAEGSITAFVISRGDLIDSYYFYRFDEGMLYLSMEAFDGPTFALKKLRAQY